MIAASDRDDPRTAASESNAFLRQFTEKRCRYAPSPEAHVVPAIVYFELKRELLRAKKSFGIGRLDQFVNAHSGRYLPLSDSALRLAAELWAKARQDGRPTADGKALDIDVIIASQALSFGQEVVVATTNPKHLSQFVLAKPWNEIVP